MTSGNARSSRLDLLLVVVLAAAPFLPALLTGRTLYYRDVGQNYIPARALAAEMIREGHLPLWNPLRGAGQPFLANPNFLVLRPTTPLFLLLPSSAAPSAMTLSVILLLAVSAWGTWGFLRETGHSRAACIIGAAAFSLSGAMQSLGQLMNLLEAAAWMPVALWMTQRALVRGWRPWAILAGGAFALIVSAGEPILIAITALAGLALPGVRGSRPAGWIRIAAAIVAFGILIAAIQVLPALELTASSRRGAGLGEVDTLRWSLPPQALLQSIVPALWGDPARSSPDRYWGTGLFDSSLPLLLSIHVGAPVLLLSIAGAVAGAARRSFGPILLAAAGVVLAFGRFTPVYSLLVSWVPGGSSVRFPVKWILLSTWIVAVLAADGFDAVVRNTTARRANARLAVAAAAAAAGLVLLAALWTLGPGAATFAPAARALLRVPGRISDAVLAAGAVPALARSAALASAAILLFIVVLRGAVQPEDGARAPRDGARGTRAVAAASLAVVVLLAGVWGVNPTAPTGVVFERSPLLGAMSEAASGSYRFFGFPRPAGFAFRTPTEEESGSAGLSIDSMAWGMRWDSRTLRNSTYFRSGIRGAFDRQGDARLDLLPGAEVARRLGDGIPTDQAARLLSAASVRWVLGYGDLDVPGLRPAGSISGESNFPVRLYEITSSVPRARVVEAAAAVGSADEAIERIREGRFDPSTTVLLEGTETGVTAVASPEVPAAAPTVAGSASFVRDLPGEVVIRTRAEKEAWLVLSDTFDPSWSATVDGRRVPILRADGMFRALRVPSGEHEARFTYGPVSVILGAVISLLAIAGGAVLCFTKPSHAAPAVP